MGKNHIYTLLMIVFMLATSLSAQERVSVYPNPSVNGKIYISTETKNPREVDIYDVLGKKVVHVIVNSDQEINISKLVSGVYIITIKELDLIITRKLVVK